MMPVYVKPVTMLDGDGYQATPMNGVYCFNSDDPDAIALAVDAGAATALPAYPPSTIYMIVNTEAATAFVRFGTASNQLATAVHVPFGAGMELPCRLGAGITHIHAGSGA